MLVLHELVEHVLTEIGHLLIPIDVFGFTYPRLEQLMISTLNKYQQYRPCHKKEFISINGNTVIPDAQRVFSIKPYSTSWEYSTSFDFKDWDWNEQTKTLSTITSGDFLVQYLGKYTVENSTSLSYVTTELFPEETLVSLPILGHFKKGTLKVTLDEGVIDSEVFSVDINNDSFLISTSSVLFNKLTTSSVVRVSSDNVLPSPLLPDYDYYVIKKSNGFLYLALTYEDSIKESKVFTTDFLSNSTYLVLNNHGYVSNQPIQLETTGTLPSPLLPNVTYYVNVIDSNTIELKPDIVSSPILLFNNGLGTHKIFTGFLDFSNNGTGTHIMTKQPFILQEVISSYSPLSEYIQLSGTLGDAYLALSTTDVPLPNLTELVPLNALEMILYNIKGKITDSANIVVSFNSQYKTIKELSLDDRIYVDLFKGELMKALGTSKAITRLDGLPFDISVDDLYSKGDELIQKTMEDLMNSHSKWYLFK